MLKPVSSYISQNIILQYNISELVIFTNEALEFHARLTQSNKHASKLFEGYISGAPFFRPNKTIVSDTPFQRFCHRGSVRLASLGRPRYARQYFISLYFHNHISYFVNLYIIRKSFTYFTKMEMLVTFS